MPIVAGGVVWVSALHLLLPDNHKGSGILGCLQEAGASWTPGLYSLGCTQVTTLFLVMRNMSGDFTADVESRL